MRLDLFSSQLAADVVLELARLGRGHGVRLGDHNHKRHKVVQAAHQLHVSTLHAVRADEEETQVDL